MIVELKHRINHHVLRRSKTKLFHEEFRQYFSGSHPSEFFKLVIAFHNIITLMNMSFILRKLQKVNELVILQTMKEKCGVVPA